MLEKTIGIIGLGFVGGAMEASFKKLGQTVIGYDKYKKIGSLDDILETNIVFLCLPTPFVIEHGFDISAISETCVKLSNNGYKGIVVIKSTVEPGTTQFLADLYPLELVHNPEFLTARTALQDFHNQKHIVLGETKNFKRFRMAELQDFYNELYPEAVFSICSSQESESMKLFCNNFYAVKVQLFNEFFLLCQRTGADFEVVKEMMLKNGWINEMHTRVPGPDGQLSYGGVCYTKDTSALCHFMKNKGTPHQVLEACITERNKMRKD